MKYPKVTSSELFWKTLQEGSEPTAKSLDAESAPDDVDGRILRVLEEAGGVATLFEVTVRAGVSRLRSGRAVNRLVKKGWVSRESGSGEDVVLRLHTEARRMIKPAWA